MQQAFSFVSTTHTDD